ncbi:MAG: hypothetical protein HOC71_07325 [Candidatus Latescibacteria bacterium]|nr:hypothetical protein [Candidatus Latescibacterota bacterium]
MGKVFKSYSSGYEETLPVIFTVGARKELIHSPLTLMADIIFPNDNDIVYAFGVKAAVKNTLSLYAGIKSRTDIDVQTMKAETDYSGITTFGFGISLERYRFNYACCLDDAIENIHKVTLGIRVP